MTRNDAEGFVWKKGTQQSRLIDSLTSQNEDSGQAGSTDSFATMSIFLTGPSHSLV